MTFGDKLSKLRRENNYTQEQLAELLGVSRQAISKWESDGAYPETDKLIRISRLFDCSLDYLMKDEVDSQPQAQPVSQPAVKLQIRERKSERELWGMPLWHVGKNARGVFAVGLNARGVIAVGLRARGLISVGVFSLGLLSIGTLSLGLISVGMVALGLLSIGCFAAGAVAVGCFGWGVICLGAIATGDFSLGAIATGKYFAKGDYAQGMIAIGKTEAVGSVFQKIGDLTAADRETVRELLRSIVPGYLSWARDWISFFL